jgi:hypothetical protein
MQKVKNGISAVILFLCALPVVFLAISSPDEISDRASFVAGNATQAQLYVFVLFGAAFIAAFIMLLYKIINRLNRVGLIIGSALLFAVFLIFSSVIFENFYVVPSTDSYAVFDQAMQIAKGAATTIDGYLDYFDNYSNNNFAVLMLSWFYRVLYALGVDSAFQSLFYAFIFNAVLIFASVILTYDCVRRLFGLRSAVKVLVLFVLNPLFYVLIFWVYTCTFSLPLMILPIYLAVIIYKSKSKVATAVCGALLGATTVIGYFLRPTICIPIIAVVITSFLYINRENLKKVCVTFVSSVICFAVLFFVVNNTVNSMIVSTSKNYPITHWVMMGLHNDGTVNETDNAFTSSFGSKEKSKVAISKEIEKSLNGFTFSSLMKHIAVKSEITWAEGSGGYNMRTIQDTKFTPFYDYIVNGRADAFLLYVQMFRVATLMLIAISLITQMLRRRASSLFVFSLTLLGGIIFYAIWEAKSGYSVPFLPIMFVLAQNGADILYSGIKKFSQKRATAAPLCATVGVCAAVVMASLLVSQAPALYREQIWYDNTVVSHTNQFNMSDLILRKTANTLTQEFYAHKPFNAIEIKAERKGANKDSKYLIQLQNSGGIVLREFTVASSDIGANGAIKLNFDEIRPQGKTKYKIFISPLPKPDGTVSDTIAFVRRFSQSMDQYEGKMYLSDKLQTTDLHMQVYLEYSAPYVNSEVFTRFCKRLFAVQIMITAASVFFVAAARKKRRAK